MAIKIFFQGDRVGPFDRYRHRKRDRYFQRPRRGEREAFSRNDRLVSIKDIRKADAIVTRLKPEKTTDRIVRKIERIFSRAENALEINPITSFPNYSRKDRTLKLWKKAGLETPPVETWSPWAPLAGQMERTRNMLNKEGAIFLRTNNEEAGKGICYLQADASYDEVKRALAFLRRRAVLNKVSGSLVMAAAEVDSRIGGLAFIHRIHYVCGRIIGCYALCGTGPVIHVSELRAENMRQFVEGNRQLLEVLEDPDTAAQIQTAARALGCHFGAAEFFLIDGKMIFLEFNPLWGDRLGTGQFGEEMEKRRGELEGQIPNIYAYLDRERFFAKYWNAMADWLERGGKGPDSCEIDVI